MSAVLEPRGVIAAPPLPAVSSVRLGGSAGHRPAHARDAAATRGRGAGIAVVIGVHVLVGWALTSGLAQRIAQAVHKPIDAAIVDETPPPPPPPPKVEKIVEAPKPKAPPPAYVPPPEVVPAPAPAAPAITATQAEPAPAAPIAPPAPEPAPAPPPAPVVARQDVSVACPGYQAVLSQGLEDAFDRVGIVGTVRTRLTVRGSQVADVAIVSGPTAYSKFVLAAVKRLRCSTGGAEEVQVPLDVQFAK